MGLGAATHQRDARRLGAPGLPVDRPGCEARAGRTRWRLVPQQTRIMDWPLRTLYFFGPSLYGVGFWEGRAPSEICAALTGVVAAVWERPAAALECVELIERKYYAFLISVVLVAVVYVVWRLFEIGVVRRLDPHVMAMAAIASALQVDKEEKRWPKRPPGLLEGRPSST